MFRSFTRLTAAVAVTVMMTVTGCRGAMRASGRGVGPATGAGPMAAIYPHTRADVEFMSGMIPHHAQAVLIARWAATHGASKQLQILCERIIVAQTDEIRTMREWLRDRGEPVPDSNATHHRMTMNGMPHDMLMPGMLTTEQLAQLDKARGVEFEKLFFNYMIGHHEGAIIMVDQLFDSPGAAQEEVVFRLASDVYADQTTEIERMEKMLLAIGGIRTP